MCQRGIYYNKGLSDMILANQQRTPEFKRESPEAKTTEESSKPQQKVTLSKSLKIPGVWITCRLLRKFSHLMISYWFYGFRFFVSSLVCYWNNFLKSSLEMRLEFTKTDFDAIKYRDFFPKKSYMKNHKYLSNQRELESKTGAVWKLRVKPFQRYLY